MKQNGFAVVYILVGILVIIAVAGGAYYFGKSSIKISTPKPQITTSPTSAVSSLPNQLIITNMPSSKQTITDKSSVQKLYSLVTSYPPAPTPTGIINCPMDTGLIYNLDFLKDGAEISHVVWQNSGCRFLKVGNQNVKFDTAFELAFNQILNTSQNSKGNGEYCRKFSPGNCPRDHCELSGPSCPMCLDVGRCVQKRSVSTPSPTDETANWKTYISNKFGIQFNYPINLKPQEDIGGIWLKSQDGSSRISFEQVNSTDIDYMRNISEEEAISQGWSKIIEESPYRFGLNNSIPGTKLKIRHFLNSGGTQVDELLYFRNDTHSFTVNLIGLSPDNRNLLDQIFSTFKFIDQNQTNAEGEFCGGITGKVCPTAFTCKLDGSYPDAGGKCVKE